MFSSVSYNKCQEDFEQDRQWLSEEWKRCRLESAEANDSDDTLSCSEFGSIDVEMREDEDFLCFNNNGNNYEYNGTYSNSISVGEFMVSHDYISGPNEGQTDNSCVHFPLVQQDYYSDANDTKKDENGLENLDLVGKAHTLYIVSSEFRGQSDQNIDVKSCSNEGQSDDSAKKREDCVDLSFIEEDRTDDPIETSFCKNDLPDGVDSRHCDDEPINKCLDYGSNDDAVNEVDFASISGIDEEQTEHEDHNGQNDDCIKVFVISKELTSVEELIAPDEKGPSDCFEVALHLKEPQQNYTQDKNIKHQTTQTCDILFRDKEQSPAAMFICDFCHKVFANQYKLDSHRLRSHGSGKECEERNIASGTSKPSVSDDWPPNIQKLARKINGKKFFFCNECSYRVNRCDSITKHMYRVHSEGRAVPQYQCEVCGKMFVDRAYLRNHKVSHTTEKLHSCEVCGRTFHRQPSLKRHLQTHTVDRQYSCTLCDYQTNRKHMMYKHLEHHKQGRAYVCHLCHSRLYTQLAYRSHMYEHRVPTNSCSFCKVGFSSKERMMSHMRTAHSAYEINVYKNEPDQDTSE